MTTCILNVTPELEDRLWTVARTGKGTPLDESNYVKLETSNGSKSITAITAMTWIGPATLVVICIALNETGKSERFKLELDLRAGQRNGSMFEIGCYY